MKHSVLITGSSTGIGRAVAVHCALAGHQVFAGVRSEKDGAALKVEEASIIPVIIDVTNPQSIRDCFAKISKLRDPSAVFSLVNNAGVAVAGPIEALKLSELRRQFEVNFFGLVDTTQVFLPMIRENKGKVFNVSSISGRVANLFLGAYSSSKFALEALSDALRQELAPFGVQVVLIEPGPIQTEIWAKNLQNREAVENFCDQEKLKAYKPRFEKFEKIVRGIAKRSIPASNVAVKVVAALESKKAPIRIVVAPMQSKMEMIAGELLPARLVDSLVGKVIKA